jgi:AcrR family transcriptional regulator
MEVISEGDRAGARLPRGPHRLTSEEVAADQRARLLSAMTELAGTKGYSATRVADLIDLAGVSRKTFYALFANREQLLKAAFADHASALLAAVKLASGRPLKRTRRIETLVRRLCRDARELPGAIALCAVEITAANRAGGELRETFMDAYASLIEDPSGQEPAMPQELAVTLVGALYRQLDAHAREGRAAELTRLAPQLARWAHCYQPVPAAVPSPWGSTASQWGSAAGSNTLGGRAPGTLTLAAAYLPPLRRPSRQFIEHTNRERILDAVAQLNAERGYPSLTLETIATRAGLPPRSFQAYFASIEDSFAAAMELGHMKGQSIVERARGWTPEWSEGVVDAVRALLEFLGSEPYFTRLAFVDAPLVGPGMARRSNEHAAAYARLLLDGAPRGRRPPQIAPEAIGYALFELVYRHAAQCPAAQPQLQRVAALTAYIALAPFLGGARAAEAASGI